MNFNCKHAGYFHTHGFWFADYFLSRNQEEIIQKKTTHFKNYEKLVSLHHLIKSQEWEIQEIEGLKGGTPLNQQRVQLVAHLKGIQKISKQKYCHLYQKIYSSDWSSRLKCWLLDRSPKPPSSSHIPK